MKESVMTSAKKLLISINIEAKKGVMAKKKMKKEAERKQRKRKKVVTMKEEMKEKVCVKRINGNK